MLDHSVLANSASKLFIYVLLLPFFDCFAFNNQCSGESSPLCV